MNYVNKVVFVEYEDVKELEKYDVILRTDYGTTEIETNQVQQLWNDLQDNPTDYDFTAQEFAEDMINCLGSDLYEALKTGEIDFCLVCP